MATSAKRQVLLASLSFTDAKAPILSVMAPIHSVKAPILISYFLCLISYSF